MVVVTHSEELLRRVVNRLVIFHQDRAEYFYGGYDDFLEKIGWEEEQGGKQKTEASKPKLSKKEIHARRKDIIKERSQVCNPLKKEIEKSENKIMELEESLEAANAELIVAIQAEKGNEVAQLSEKVGKIQIEIQKAFEAIEPIENKLVALNDKFEEQLEELN